MLDILIKWYDSLPSTFAYREAMDLAEELGVKKRDANSIIRESLLFERLKHGVYHKKHRLPGIMLVGAGLLTLMSMALLFSRPPVQDEEE